jgi:hypothetical protein
VMDTYPTEYVKSEAEADRKFSLPIDKNFQPSSELFKAVFDGYRVLGSEILRVFPEAVFKQYTSAGDDIRDLNPEIEYGPDQVRIYPAVGDFIQVNVDYHIGVVQIHKLAEGLRIPVNTEVIEVVDKDDLDEDDFDDLPDEILKMMESLKPSSPEELKIADKIKQILSVPMDADVDALVKEHGEDKVAEGVKSFLSTLEQPDDRWAYQIKIMSYPYQTVKAVFEGLRM